MNFASDFVYEYEEPEYEVISDEEFDRGMEVSDSDSDSDEEDAPPITRGLAPVAGIVPPPPSVPPAPPLPTARIVKCKKRRPQKVGHWRQEQQQQQQQAGGLPVGRRERRADTNVVSVNFNTLVCPSNMHTGDAVFCEGCQAILSNISVLQTEGDEKVWQCEFCDSRNVVDIEPEEKPAQDDVTFMLTPALSTSKSGPTGTDNSMVIFCVDISGSMCITTEVPGKISLRGGNLQCLQHLNDDRSDQFLPKQKRNVTYISRLQAAQAAVDQQLEEMIKDHPNRRVALIVFNNEVVVIGDGRGTPVTIAGDKLTKKEELEKIGNELPLPGDIKGTRRLLGGKLFELEEGGATALGPAMVVATTMASKHPGSKVILCTDGLANVGLGRLDKSDEEAQASAMGFYESVATTAVDNGVAVSVISMKGTDCKLIQLGMVADKTGGQMNIVDPLKLVEEFSTILQDRIIATNVVATFILHKKLFFHYEEKEESKVVRNIGNVTSETEVTFEYGVRTKKKEEQKPEKMETNQSEAPKPGGSSSSTTEQAPQGVEGGQQSETGDKSKEPQPGGSSSGTTEQPPQGAEGGQQSQTSDQSKEQKKELPFQLQIKYTDAEGAVALRVLTKAKPVTKDRSEAEKEVNMDVFGKHTAQISSNLALDGQFTQARSRALMNQRLAWRHKKSKPAESTRSKAAYKGMFGKIKSVENYMNLAQKRETASFGRTHSDEEDEVDDVEQAGSKPWSLFSALNPFAEGKDRSKKKMMKRQTTMSDEAAQMFYDMKSPSKAFKE